MKDLTDSIIEEDAKATADNTGYTRNKSKSRTRLEALTHKVAAALMAWSSFGGSNPLIEADDYLISSLETSRDSDMYVLARQLYIKANPVKVQLTPYNSGSADVDLLNTLAENFLLQIQVSRNTVRESARARRRVAGFFCAGQ